MADSSGTFIALEGTDGSGKTTQFKLLAARLSAEGYDVATFDFPQYDQPSSFFVREYLNGRYGSADEVSPYTASLFYALDRYQAASKIREALDQGKIVLSNRFVGSNMAHQGTKFRHAEERRGYFIWLDNLEFEMLRVPRPDTSIVLRVPAEVAQTLVDRKGERKYTNKKRDLHEADLSHMQRSVEVYDDMCQLFPKDFVRIDCTRDSQLLSIDKIQDIIWQKVLPLLPTAPKKKKQVVAEAATGPKATTTENTHKYYTPPNLDESTKKIYAEAMDKILSLHAQMSQKLAKHADRDAAMHYVNAVLPVATEPQDQTALPSVTSQSTLKKLAEDYLPANYSNHRQAVILTDVWPRNEFDLVPDMLYEPSNLSLDEVRAAVATWPYAKKEEVFTAYLADQPGPALEKARYSLDVMCDYATFRDLSHRCKAQDLEQQELTPRYGYEVPKLIEEAELSDQFEQCFDISLRLHSLLQQAGYAQEAQYATLLGHLTRWKATLNARQLFKLYAGGGSSPGSSQLLRLIHEKVSAKHPLLADAIEVN